MNDLVKSCRNVHISLVFTSITILLFALARPNGQNIYSNALNEIASIKKSFVTLEHDENQITNAFYKNSNFVRELSVSFPRIDLGKFAITTNINNFATGERPLKDIYSLIVNRRKAVDDLMSSNYFAHIYLFEISDSESRASIRSNYNEISRFSSIATIDFSPIMQSGEECIVRVKLSGNAKENGGYFSKVLDMKARRKRLEGIKIEVFDRILYKNELITAKPDDSEALPMTRQIWEEISELNLEVARYKLISKSKALNNSNDSIKLFGVTIDHKLAVFGGPIYLVATMLLLLAHVSRIRSLSDINQCELLLDIPWVALYPSCLGIVLTSMSTILLPITATLWLVTKFATETPYLLAAVYILAQLFIGALIYVNIKKLRMHLRQVFDKAKTARIAEQSLEEG